MTAAQRCDGRRQVGHAPRGRDGWQHAVNLAEIMLELDSVRQYGLIAGGPQINVDRCLDLIGRGARLGIRPAVTDALRRRVIADIAAEASA